MPDAVAHRTPLTPGPRALSSGLRLLDGAAEVERRHLRVVQHRLGLAGQQHATALHHHALLRQPQPEAHVLLDEQQRLAGVDHHLHRVADVRRAPSGRARATARRAARASARASASGRTRPSGAGRRTGCPRGRRRAPHDGEQLRDLVVASRQQLLVAALDGAHQDVLLDGQTGEERVRLRTWDTPREDLGGCSPFTGLPSSSTSPSRHRAAR